MIAMPLTLSRYFAMRFARAIAGVFLTAFALVFMLDFIELVRRAGDAPGASTALLAMLSLYRTPSVAEQILPFAVLFGSMVAFLALSAKLELVVTRAAGISVWQFTLPAVLVALAIGLAGTMLYNPAAALLKSRADAIEAKAVGRTAGSGKDMWIRQRSVDGQAIIRARGAGEGGAVLAGVTFFGFEPSGALMERIEADRAELVDSHWQLSNARVLRPGHEPESFGTYLVATNLTADQLRQSFVPPQSVPFWRLDSVIERTELAGLDATRYRLHRQSLIARPVLLIAMVFVAASVSLRFFRFGGIARAVLGGVAAGFVLYVATQLVENLGATGVVGPGVAAWLPAVVGSLLGVLALLHQEDG
jgi:lipopolysaccharide export system permease protein